MPKSLKWYTTFISFLGILATCWAVWNLLRGPTDWPALLLFMVVVVLVELTATDLLPGSRATISVSSAIFYASIIVFGASGGTLVAATSGLATTLLPTLGSKGTAGQSKTPVLRRALFNMAAFGLSSLSAGLIYRLGGGQVGEIASWVAVLPIILGALTQDLVNAACIVGAVAIQTRQPPLRVWRENFVWAAPINILTMALGGGALALGFLRLGAVGLATFLLPVLATSYAFRLYVERSKEQMNRLEELIAERTAELQAANEELRRADRQKTQFYSIINHEMRTPLTSVLGYCDLLRARSDLDPRSAAFVETIKDNGQRLLDLVNNLLDVSRIEAGRMNLVREPVDLHEVISAALRVIQPLADAKLISVNLHVPKELPPVDADAKKLSQVLVNLMSNAVKYTPDTGAITVTAGPTENGERLQVDVADTGIGIPAEQLPQIFDRFSRVETELTRDTVGTGLGLTISKGLVEAHGGGIWAESEEGVGSVFHFTLPIHNEVG